jgi:hypothetical protein
MQVVSLLQFYGVAMQHTICNVVYISCWIVHDVDRGVHELSSSLIDGGIKVGLLAAEVHWLQP